jgi:hypothetical protein
MTCNDPPEYGCSAARLHRPSELELQERQERWLPRTHCRLECQEMSLLGQFFVLESDYEGLCCVCPTPGVSFDRGWRSKLV